MGKHAAHWLLKQIFVSSEKLLLCSNSYCVWQTVYFDPNMHSVRTPLILFMENQNLFYMHICLFRCNVCGKEFFEKALFRRHVKKATHGKKGRVKQNLERECEQCGRKFTQLREYRRHVNNHQGETPSITGGGGGSILFVGLYRYNYNPLFQE